MTRLAWRLAAADEDWGSIHALLTRTFAFMEGRIDPPSSLHRTTPADLAAKVAAGAGFLAIAPKGVVGCAFGEAKGDAFYVGKVAVDDAWRGRGIGRGLIDLARWEASRRRLTALELETRIELTENHAAFARLGFEKTTETAHPGHDRPTSITMRAPVAPVPAPPFLAHANAAEGGQRAVLERLVRADADMMSGLEAARSLGLSQWRIASGAVYNFLWNRLTGRPGFRGVKDIDLIYWDDDLSWEAEDRVIRRATALDLPVPIEVRNQARVPLWYESRFGAAYPAIRSADESLRYYASRTHAVALRLEDDGRLDIAAPFGLSDLFGFRVTPNPALPNRESHEAKAARAAAHWPEVTAVAWPGVAQT